MRVDLVQRPQLLNLTTLRFFAALSIFLHHLDTLGLHPSAMLWGINLSWTVSFFFVLSGFVLAYSYSGRLNNGRAVIQYLLQRMARLWPVHVACLVILGATLGFGDASRLQVYLALTLQNAWLPAYGSGFALNSVSWSISVEIFFYALFPFIIRLSNRQLLGLFAANAAFIGGIVVFYTATGLAVRPDQAADPLWYRSMIPTGGSVLLFFPPVRLIEFLAGILAFRVFAVARLPTGSVGIVQLGTLTVLLAYMTQHNSLVQYVDANISSAAAQVCRQFGAFPLFAFTVFAFSHQSGSISRILAWKPLVFLGEVSFAFYMVHLLVLRYMAQHWTLIDTGDRLVAATAAFLTSLLLATALSYLVERPILLQVKTISRRVLATADRARAVPV
jgi:peptidoglycan/LPS O-acetylase OafA/YrhL